MNTKKRYIFTVFMMIFPLFFSYGQQRFTVEFVNQTGYDIEHLYISPATSEEWQEDKLSDNVLLHESSVKIELVSSPDSAFIYDIMAVDTDGDKYIRYDTDLKEEDDRLITFTFDDFDFGDSAEGASDLTGFNETAYQEAYLEGYRDAYREAYNEAFREGFRAGMEEADLNRGERQD